MIILYFAPWQIVLLVAMLVFLLVFTWRGFDQILKERDELEKEVKRLTQQNEALTTTCRRLENQDKHG